MGRVTLVIIRFRPFINEFLEMLCLKYIVFAVVLATLVLADDKSELPIKKRGLIGGYGGLGGLGGIGYGGYGIRRVGYPLYGGIGGLGYRGLGGLGYGGIGGGYGLGLGGGYGD